MKFRKLQFAQVFGLLMIVSGAVSFVINQIIAGVVLVIFGMILIGMSSSLK